MLEQCVQDTVLISELRRARLAVQVLQLGGRQGADAEITKKYRNDTLIQHSRHKNWPWTRRQHGYKIEHLARTTYEHLIPTPVHIRAQAGRTPEK